MEEAPENGKESPHSAHANGLIDWLTIMICTKCYKYCNGVPQILQSVSCVLWVNLMFHGIWCMFCTWCLAVKG